MNYEEEPQFDSEPTAAFRRLRDRKRWKRRRCLRIVLTLVLCAALLAGVIWYVHQTIIKPYLDTPISSTPSAAEAEVPPPAEESQTPPDTAAPEDPEQEDPAPVQPEQDAQTPPAEDPPTQEELPPLTLAQSSDETTVLDLELYSSSAILIDLNSAAVLAEKAPDTRIYPASMTKIMTLLVASEHLPNLDETFTMTQQIIDPLYLAGASMAGFVHGEDVTLRDLLYGAVLPSGAEATQALAQVVAGGEEGFVALMNEKAAELGLQNTHFMNTSGLHDENHYSTVRELALILAAALQNETCAQILRTENYTAEPTGQHPDGLAMTNKFLYRVHHEYSTGGAQITAAKTGYTAEAMNCCASAGQTPDGREVLCVTANAWTGEFCIEDHIALYTQYCGSAKE